MCRLVQPRQVEDIPMPELFEKTWIQSLELSNRAVRSATWSGVGDDRGYVTDRAVEFYRELARGDIGLIITGYQYVLPNGQQLRYMIGNYEDDQVEGLSRLAEAVHAEGGAIAPQIVHCGVRADKRLFREDDEVWGPSAIPDPVTGHVPKEVTRSEIAQLVEAYAAAAARALQSGFDGVQLHGAHGYGINQFLSALWNQRGDAYGGSLKKRYRFLGEVLEAVRGAVGDDFPVLIKLSGADFAERGLVLEDSCEIARRLAEDGIDAIEVSGGTPASPKHLLPMRTKIRTEEDEAYLADLAASIKEKVNVPVITVGGIRSVQTIDRILKERQADYVAMSRPFIREPLLLKRWKSGDRERATCISCGGCFESGIKGIGISCKVAREREEEAQG
jgi:2,4-dienoyl-CoA reductase-like NADH-dependent reductase (Old Yellow Enzyme family)